MTIQQRTSQVPARSQPGASRPMPEIDGWPQHWYAWRELIPLLADSWRLIICPDLRGFGWTDAPAGGYRTADLAADTVALLDTLELDQVDVIGHGEGGRVAFELCLSQPDRVRRPVTLGAMHPYPSLPLLAPHAWRFWWTPVAETSLLGRWVIRRLPAVTRVLRVSAANPAALGDAVIEEFVASVRQPARARASERLMHEFAYHEMIPALLGANRSRRLRTPTLMLNGEHDFFTPARTLGGPRPYASDLRIQVIPAAGHLLAEECPQAIAAAVSAFLR